MKRTHIISEQAARLKKIRLYLGMTRQQFGEAVEISQFTIRSWENGAKKFTADGIQRVISSLKEKINFSCPFDWLMHGVGSSPISLYEESTLKEVNDIQFETLEENLLKEVITFKQLNKLASVTIVSDEKFSPIAEVGDYIGMISLDILTLHNYFGKIVFATMKNNASLFGVLEKNKNIIYIKQLNDCQPKKLNPQKINKLYKLVWLRKIF